MKENLMNALTSEVTKTEQAIWFGGAGLFFVIMSYYNWVVI